MAQGSDLLSEYDQWKQGQVASPGPGTTSLLDEYDQWKGGPETPLKQDADGTWSARDVLDIVESVHPAIQNRGHILWTLGLLDRPRNAIASTLAGKGFMPGLKGETDVSNADLLGIPRTTPEDTWPGYLAKGGAHLASNVIGDPLNLLFGTGAITKGLGLAKQIAPGITKSLVGRGLDKVGAEKALEWYQGTRLGGATTHAPAGDAGRKAMEVLGRVEREGSTYPLREAIGQTNKQLDEALIARGMSDPERAAFRTSELFEALERPGTSRFVDEELRPIVQPLMDMSLEKFGTHQGLKELFGQPASAAIDEAGYEYLPRVVSGLGKWLDPKALGATPRTIKRWYDNPELTGDPLAIGKAGRGTRVVEKEGRYWRTGDTGDQPGWMKTDVEVFPGQASRAEAASVATHRNWIEDPVQALNADIMAKQGKINYLNLLKGLKDEGILQTPTAGRLSANYKRLDVPGFQDLAAPKHIARWLENKAGTMYDPETAQGVIEKFFKHTKPGQLADAFQNSWKRNMLAWFPGYWAGNIGSNAGQMFGASPSSLLRLPAGYRTITGSTKEVVPGLTGEALREEFRLRNLLDTGYQGQAGEALGSRTGDVSKIPFMDMSTGKLGTPGEMIGRVGKGWGNATDWLFEKGTKYTEDPARAAVAIDWLKRNVKGAPSPEELDKAARYAKDFLFTAEDATRAERTATHLLPFLGWTRNIAGRTAKDVVTQPQRLANLGRIYDFMFTPYPDKESLPEWQREQGPAAGFFGGRMKTSSGEPGTFLTGRFTPQGVIEQFASRPADTLLGMLGPLAKIPREGLGNWSDFKKRPIDELAGGGVSAMLNPLTGGPYSVAPQKMFGARLPAMWDYALTNWTPAGRYARTFNTLMSNVMPGMDDPNQMPMTVGARAKWAVTGGKLYPVDETRNQYYKAQGQRREDSAVKALARRAARRGDISGYEHYMEQAGKIRDRRLTPIPFR